MASSTCLCKAVSLTVKGKDKKAVLCHCTNCVKSSGSAFAYNHRFLDATITYQQGEDMVVEYRDGDTKSGGVVCRHFCRTCVSRLLRIRVRDHQGEHVLTHRAGQGTPLFLTTPGPNPGLVILNGGAMKDRSQPSFEMFGEEKQTWLGDVTAKKAKL